MQSQTCEPRQVRKEAAAAGSRCAMGCLTLHSGGTVSYEVIARKWRPQSFHELVGQEAVSQTILNALRADRLPHALLFTGTRGVGKTSSARILAKSLRCPQAVDFKPCNQCHECEEIRSGSSINVIEIDGASNNGVDAIRELRDSVGYMPSSGKYKIYIIDEVHMLSNSAFNALLKTLEEPPPHVIFILATTEVQKIPITVLSRCQRFDFRKIASQKIAEHLDYICRQEKVQVDSKSLWLLARQAEGSMRDALSLLDQAISFCNKELDYNKIIEVLGLTDRQLLLDCLQCLAHRDKQQALQIVDRIRDVGLEPQHFMRELIAEIRNLLVVKLGGEDLPSGLVDLPPEEIEILQQLANSYSSEEIHMLFDMSLKAGGDLHKSAQASLVLEMALLRMTHAPYIRQLVAATATEPSEKKKSPEPPQVTETKPIGKAEGSPVVSKSSAASNSYPAYLNDLGLAENWCRLVQFCLQEHAILAAQLEHCIALKLEEESLELGIRKSHEFLLNSLQSPDRQKQLLDILEQAGWGSGIKTLRWQRMDDKQLEWQSPAEQAREKKEKAQQELQDKIHSHPLVGKAVEVFNAKIIAIKETKL